MPEDIAPSQSRFSAGLPGESATGGDEGVDVSVRNRQSFIHQSRAFEDKFSKDKEQDMSTHTETQGF